jgi:hypothetical protein
MPKLSVSDIVLAMLKSKEWVGSNEIEALFEPGTPGHFSWPQRLRGLREKGYIIDRRIRKGTKNLSEWHLTMPETLEITPEPKEAIDLRGFVEAKSTNSQNPVDIALKTESPTEGLETQNSSPVYFEKEGQLSFLGGV